MIESLFLTKLICYIKINYYLHNNRYIWSGTRDGSDQSRSLKVAGRGACTKHAGKKIKFPNFLNRFI
jgi:hypothetical protein